MSYQSRQEYLKQARERYAKASSRQEKTQIIDEVVATLNYHRKHVISVFNRKTAPKKHKQTRAKSLQYQESLPTIELVWEALDYPCAERLHPVLPSIAQRLEEHRELTLSPTIREQLDHISRATLGRYLSRMTSPKPNRRVPRNKPSSRLASMVPVDRYDWDEDRPGALEIDLVEHNGGNSRGHFAYTLTVVDIVTGYSHRRAVLGRSQRVVLGALSHILDDWPFQPWGLHSDNGSEFLNDQLFRFSQTNGYELTRSRAYKKNDNAHAEQKNKQYVREFVGYERYDTHEEVAWLNELYEVLDLYANLVLPMRKVVAKARIGKRIRKSYDQARTPLTRLIESDVMAANTQQQLLAVEQYINPLELHRDIEQLLDEQPVEHKEKEAVLNE